MSDQYARAATKVAVAQLVEAAGFDSAQQSSLDILTDLLIQYTSQLGNAVHTYAEIAGRSAPNATDVAAALQELGVTLPQLQRYANSQDDLPFPQTITTFPIQKPVASKTPTFSALGENPPAHIPAFLPALPDAHTYKATPQYPTAAPPSVALPAQQELGEGALAMLEARTQPHNDLLATMLPEKEEDAAAEEVVVVEAGPDAKKARPNPFLETPLWEEQDGEREPVKGVAPPDVTAWEAAEQPNTLPQALMTGDTQFKWAWAAKAARGSNREDGYDDDAAVAPHDKAARRQKRVAEGTKIRVEAILSAHGEDLEAAGDEEGMITREQI